MLFLKLSILYLLANSEFCINSQRIMDTNIHSYICRSTEVAWVPLTESGVDTAGIFVKALRRNPDGRPPTILLKFEAGASYPYHNHPAGEELFVMEGTCIIEGVALQAGDYLYTPPGFKHSVRPETGCVLLFVVPEEVEILA